MSYLRGLDGVLPTGMGAPTPSTPQQTISGGTDTRAATIGIFSLIRAPSSAPMAAASTTTCDASANISSTSIAASGRGVRLGVTAIGVLGNDTYDKLLVLDALRGYFPRAVFFAADLDARLIGREVRRSTRNLVVASSYGLRLRPDLQRAAPPFRDTYQTGIYLSTRVAMDSVACASCSKALTTSKSGLPIHDYSRSAGLGPWPCRGKVRDPASRPTAASDPTLTQCQNIHPDDEWRGFVDPLPDRWAIVAVVVMVLTATVLGSAALGPRVHRRSRRIASSRQISKMGRPGGAMYQDGLFVEGLWVIKSDVETATGEPFTWLEGVSIWPTQILQMVLLVLTWAFSSGAHVASHTIDEVARSSTCRHCRRVSKI